MLTIMDVAISFLGKCCKRRKNSIIKVPCSSRILFWEIILFLSHKVNNIVHKWIVFDIFPLAEKERDFFFILKTRLYVRDCVTTELSRPISSYQDPEYNPVGVRRRVGTHSDTPKRQISENLAKYLHVHTCITWFYLIVLIIHQSYQLLVHKFEKKCNDFPYIS